jgi:PAS domain S-box-containing protein
MATAVDLGAVVNALPAPVWTTRDDGRCDFVNRYWCEYTGLSPDVALDHGWLGAIHPEDLQPFLDRWSAIQQSGLPHEIDGRMRRSDGEYRWFVFRPSLMDEVDGGARWCWHGSYADEAVTSDGRMRRLFDALPWQAGFLDSAGVLEFTNRQSLEDFGMTKLELELPASSGIFHVDDYETVRKNLQALLATGEMMDQEVRMLYPNSRYRWTRARCVPVRNAQGKIVRYVTFQIDVDDLKQAEALLAGEVNILERVARGDPLEEVLGALSRQVEELCGQPAKPTAQEQDVIDRFAKIAGIAIDRARADSALKASEAEQRRVNMQLTDAHRLSRTGSFTWDVVADSHVWTEEIFRLFEFDPATKIDMQMIFETIHPEDRPAVESLLGRAVASSEIDLAFRVIPRSGSVKHARIIGRRIGADTDRAVYMGAMQDVTAGKVAEEALSQARLELTHVARTATLSAMTASITHEVSQPISGILTNSNTCARMLAADPPNVAGAAETVRRTIRDANRASEVIKRLRAMFAKRAPTLEMVDLNEATQEVIALSSAELRRARSILQTEFSAGMPPIKGDRVQLQQVILNLLLNAADAMSAIEDRPRTLQVQTQFQDDSVNLLVRDAGVGVDPLTINKLFEAFYTTKAHGLGIGLAISRSIIESHKGKLWALPNEGPGATFGFSIPFASEAVTHFA